MNAETLSVSIWRGKTDGQFVSYSVPRLDSQTVLDVVTYVQRTLDPSLSYRFSCRVGMCGSCAMSVNGVARWTCRTHVSKVAADGVLELAPLSNLPVIKDLAADMAPFSISGQARKASLRASEAVMTILRRCRQIQSNGKRPTPESNASAAAFATPPATR